jgi:hypothetical protein
MSMPSTALSLAVTPRTLAAIAEEVARGLATSVSTPGGCFVQTPMQYPSGSAVVARIDGTGNRFFVSDNGMGYEEAIMLDAARSYAFLARALIRGTGVSFDSRSFFVAEATNNDLVGVVVAVANFSQRAVIETTMRHEARKLDTDRALLLSRLQSAFGRHVEKDIVIKGASTVEWEVTARVVAAENVVSIFDYARPHKNSVSSTVAKFHDIARLEAPPNRIVTVHDFEGMGNFVGLLSQAARVVELARTADDELRRLVA